MVLDIRTRLGETVRKKTKSAGISRLLLPALLSSPLLPITSLEIPDCGSSGEGDKASKRVSRLLPAVSSSPLLRRTGVSSPLSGAAAVKKTKLAGVARLLPAWQNMMAVQQMVPPVDEILVPVQQSTVPVQQNHMSVHMNVGGHAGDSGPVLVPVLQNPLSLQAYKSCKFLHSHMNWLLEGPAAMGVAVQMLRKPPTCLRETGQGPSNS